MLRGTVCKSYVRRAVLYGSEVWCLKESELGILRRARRSMVRAMCGVQLNDRKGARDFMSMLDLNEAKDHLGITNTIRSYGHVLRR